MSAKSGESPRDSTTFAAVLVLWALTLTTQISGLLYQLDGVAEPGQSLVRTLLVSGAFLSVLTLPAAVVGVHLSRRMGALGTPLLSALMERQVGAWRRLVREAQLAVPVGLVLGAIMLFYSLALQQYLPPSTRALGDMGVTGGLLASLGAAVGEEVWSRLGVMTLLAWLMLRLRRRSVLTSRVAWSANILAAVAFGLMHLPSVAQNDGFTALSVAGTVLGNSVVGTFYGWLYWRRSLLAAMMGHFSVDLVLHVFTALGR